MEPEDVFELLQSLCKTLMKEELFAMNEPRTWFPEIQSTPGEKKEMKVKSLSGIRLFATLWTVALPSSSVLGIFQGRILEWVAISFSRGSSQSKD